jgi:hypothetical protein
MLFSYSVDLEFVIIILVSSAKRIGLDLLVTVLGKSFIYNKNSKGPKIDPWGTPFLTFPHSECVNHNSLVSIVKVGFN